MEGYLEKGVQTPMAQGRCTRIMSIIEWIRTSKLSIKNFVSRRFHTGFIENNTLVLTKPQIDGANRDLQNQVSSLLSNYPSGIKPIIE